MGGGREGESGSAGEWESRVWERARMRKGVRGIELSPTLTHHESRITNHALLFGEAAQALDVGEGDVGVAALDEVLLLQGPEGA